MIHADPCDCVALPSSIRGERCNEAARVDDERRGREAPLDRSPWGVALCWVLCCDLATLLALAAYQRSWVPAWALELHGWADDDEPAVGDVVMDDR